MTFNEKWAAAIGGFMLVITIPITTGRFSDTEPAAEALGRGFGIVAVAIAFALLARFVYVRVRGGGRRTISAWVLLIAGVLAMIFYVGASAREREREQEQIRFGAIERPVDSGQPAAASAASSSRSSPQKT